MGIEKRREKIGDHTYETVTLGTKQGQKILLRLFRILGPAAAEVLAQGPSGIGKALSLASSGTTDTDLDFVTETFAGVTKVLIVATTTAGTREIPTELSRVYDGHFAGRWDEWALWIGWVVRENFASFFGGKALEELAAQFTKDQASESGSPKD